MTMDINKVYIPAGKINWSSKPKDWTTEPDRRLMGMFREIYSMATFAYGRDVQNRGIEEANARPAGEFLRALEQVAHPGYREEMDK